ncbi:MAG: hypothetical protein HY619_02250, partial [Thaumarchaeota archaeon]|nr:hypothetical protein [Nitrososphaerota archaeon]
HAWPKPEAFSCDCLIMGHHHFTFEFRDQSGLRLVEPVWLISTWNTGAALAAYMKTNNEKSSVLTKQLLAHSKTSTLIVLPAFNPLLGGFPVNTEPQGGYLGPIFTPGSIDMKNAELLLLDGTFLGRLGDLGRQTEKP